MRREKSEISTQFLVWRTKHNLDLTEELTKGILVAKRAMENVRKMSTRKVADIHLTSVISDMILRDFSYGKRAKIDPAKFRLPIAGSKIRYDTSTLILHIPCLDAKIFAPLPIGLSRIWKAELDEENVYLTFELPCARRIASERYLGIDVNVSRAPIVVGDPRTGEFWKLGAELFELRKRHEASVAALKRAGNFRALKGATGNYSNRMNSALHRITKEVVMMAAERKSGIVMEDLSGIEHKERDHWREKMLKQWGYSRLQHLIDYKAGLMGVEVHYVSPYETSSRCYLHRIKGERSKTNIFYCSLGHSLDGDANAAFNIALKFLTDSVVS